ncbi:hypothetical protein [Reichenbachiella sp. MSK19-1]|uniref:hypothetical protein n=1 Tax=Reichenbachiella sp. MSK19-1 TaxID=1897631 RepID=UPI001314D6C5|nr:hypothetical protein [Reichenbachiella sp. MSK19-1]
MITMEDSRIFWKDYTTALCRRHSTIDNNLTLDKEQVMEPLIAVIVGLGQVW